MKLNEFKKMQNSTKNTEKLKKSEIQLFNREFFWRFLTKELRLETDPTRTVQRSALCRSRRELSNPYFLANFGFDTAENEPFKVRYW